ncbi:class I SAM-dependent methyltransferase [Candidatus Bathyarchaeota archaeon]|nr:class I SAM-dependent methyltransferase [Candidatus Bathyarchaeota archaeon]
MVQEPVNKKQGLDKKRYNRLAPFYDQFESPMELFNYSRWRANLRQYIPSKGTILEVGVGTGKNLPFYNKHLKIVAVDVSEKMLQRAKNKKSRADINLIQMDIEELGFLDEVFDAAISTYVFCSVEDPIRGLRQIKRVLKKDGVVVFLEHMRSEKELMGRVMDVLNPIVARNFGPNINRRTIRNIQRAGFKILKEEYLLSTVFRLIVAKKTENKHSKKLKIKTKTNVKS